MELYQLRTFLAVADEGHLTRAAEKLFTSQPAVSAHVRALEEELGVKLFERTPRGMSLTAAGHSLQEQARRVLEAARAFKHSADSLRGSVAGDLTFGVNNRPEFLRFMEIMRELTAAHADLRYEVINGSSGVIIQGLEEGTIDIGFFEGHCDSPRLSWDELDTIELCLAAPAAWAEELSEPDWKMLEARPWIFVSPHCSYFRAIQNICQEQGLRISPRFRVNEDLTVLNLVAEGLGLTLIARRQIEANSFQGKVVALPHFRARVPLRLGWQTARAAEPSIAAVREVVKKVWNSPPPSPARRRPADFSEAPPPARSAPLSSRSTRDRSTS